MNNEQLWQAILGELELTLSKANFTTWFKNTFILKQENKSIIVAVPNAFTKAWLENKYQEKVTDALKHVTNNAFNQIFYKVETRPYIETSDLKQKIQTIKSEIWPHEISNNKYDEFGLNPKYTFDKFVVGKNNELAHAAGKSVVKSPGTSYNPLFIYGSAGLGKTHLIQAIGHDLIKKKPDIKLIYVSCEKFTNEFIYSIRNNKTNEFQKKYRGADVLIVDDIQFMANKEQTQEQFFHTFNELHQKDKQIILSSDRPPKAINIEQRLQSRFEWGMIADITEPDYETRLAILEQKLIDKKFALDRNITEYLAENIQNNIRELEGALNRIYANFELKKEKPNIEDVKQVLQSITTIVPKSSLTSKIILNEVAKFYDITLDQLKGSSRKKELVVPRQIAMYLMREEINASFPNIGNELGGRDHTTAMHSHEKIKDEVLKNEKIKQDIGSIKQKLYSG
ncbi:MAG: chromosomal replication initiator protein DnaA [Patescibacteria group bacterium]